MTRRPHDALFKAAFEQPEHAGPMLRCILPQAICRAIAWATLTPEPGSYVDPKLADAHSDLLFSVALAGSPAYVYVLLEHQSSYDADMPLRMLKYMVRIWERHRKQHGDGPLPPIIPTLISHARGGWSGAACFADLFEPHPASIPGLASLVPMFSLLVDDLAHLSNQDIKDRALAAFQTLVLWVLRDGRDKDSLLQSLGDWTAELQAALEAPDGLEAVGQMFRYIALVSQELQLDGFRAIILEQLPEAEDAIMTIAEQLREEGRRQGLQRGLEQGRRERVRMLERLLTHKFGQLAPEHQARLESASDEQLERYVDRILAADTLEAVLAD